MINNIKSKILFSSVVAFFLTGCATIMSGSTEIINVQAINDKDQKSISGAICRLTDSKGNTYVVGGNPGTTVITRGNGALQAKCTAEGYHQKDVGVGTSFNAWTIANIIFWPGLIVDGISGAYSSYPSHITVLMEKSSKS